MVFKMGQHTSPETEFKKGVHYSPENEFRRGHVPYNKGMRRGSMSPQTEFKAGVHSPNFKGYYKPHANMRGGIRKPEVYVTIPEQIPRMTRGRAYQTRRRISLARHLWQQHYGRIPRGMCVYNRAGNPLDVRIESLVLVTRAELLYLNRQVDKIGRGFVK